jgi:hypothetical protein
MRDIIFAATDRTFTRARLGVRHVLFQVVSGTTKHGEVLSEIPVPYDVVAVVVALVERAQPTTDPVLAKLLVQETTAQMQERC